MSRRVRVAVAAAMARSVRLALALVVAVALAVAAALAVPQGARAAFELGDASPGSLGAASPEGPRLWMTPGFAGVAPPPGVTLAVHHASLFDAPGLAGDGIAVSVLGSRAAASLDVMQVSAPAARERTVRLRLREEGARAVQVGLCAERLDLAVDGAPSLGGWALGVEVAGRAAIRGAEWRVVAAADRAARSGALDGLGVAAEFRAEATVATRAAALTLADRWSPAGTHRPRVTLDLPLGGHALLRAGRSASPGAVGLALAVRAGRYQISVGRLEDPSGAGIVSAGVTLLATRTPPTGSGAASRALRGSTPPSVPLWGNGAFATMLRDTEIRRISAGVASGPPATVGGDPAEAAAAAAGAERDSGAEWLPESVEDNETPEALDDPDEPSRAGASFATGSAGRATSRLWWRSAGMSAAVARRGDRREVGIVAERGGVSLAAGVFATPGMGLVGERSRLTRGTPRGSLGAAPRDALRPAWGSGADANGLAVAWTPRAARGSAGFARSRFTVRVVGGSRARAEGSVVAGEIRAAVGAGAASAVTVRAARWREPADGAERPRSGVAFGLGWTRRRGPGRLAAEVARDASGLHADLAAGVRDRLFAAAARWRRRAGAARPGGLDLEAGWVTRAGAARFRWRAWSGGRAGSRGALDDGRAELDVRAGRGGPGTSRLRLGVKPRGGGGTAGERLAVADLVAARERGRTLRLFASVRATPAGAGWRHGRVLGASLRLERSRRGAIDLRAEAVRTEPNGAAAGSAFEIAGAGSLRSRTRSGLRLAARGWIALGAWRVGAAVDDEETDATRPREARGSLWMTWNDAPGAP